MNLRGLTRLVPLKFIAHRCKDFYDKQGTYFNKEANYSQVVLCSGPMDLCPFHRDNLKFHRFLA